MVNTETRVKNSARNIIFSMIAYILQIVLGFVVRRYFIFHFGTEYLGLSSLFANILSLLSLAELGFGTAIVFAMYKPMADGNTEKVRELLQFYKRCYFVIGGVILAIGLCVLPFMNFFETKVPDIEINLYLVYLIYLFNSVISYFFAHRRSLLYTSQRSDIESKVNMSLNLVSTLLQLLIILFLQNFYLYILVSGVISIVNNVVVCFITKKMYAEYLVKPKSYLDAESRKSINKNIRAMIFHKIGSAVVYSTDSLIIYLMLGSTVLGKYSNYLLITTYVTSFISLITGAVRGSVGNSIASENVERNYSLFKKLNFLYLWIVSFCTMCIYALSDQFIDVVLTKSSEDYLILDKTILVLISVNFFLTTSRYMTGMFKECAGIFYADRYKSLFEALINLVTSIVLCHFIGLPGIILGTIISNITTALWIEPYMLNKHYMKKSTLLYFAKYIVFFIATVVGAWFTWFVCNKLPTGGITLLVARFAICAFVPNVVLLVFLWWMPEFRDCVNFVLNILKELFEKHKKQTKEQVVVLKTDAVDIDSNGVPDISTTMVVTDKESTNNIDKKD